MKSGLIINLKVPGLETRKKCERPNTIYSSLDKVFKSLFVVTEED